MLRREPGEADETLRPAGRCGSPRKRVNDQLDVVVVGRDSRGRRSAVRGQREGTWPRPWASSPGSWPPGVIGAGFRVSRAEARRRETRDRRGPVIIVVIRAI